MPRPDLVCPACRHAKDGALYVQLPVPHGTGLRCACGAQYPIVDGVPLLFRELDAWLASEGPEAIRRVDVDPELEAELCRRSGGTLARNHSLRQVYQASRAGPLQDRLRSEEHTSELQ